jgi:site-specific DNA-methyltransferase (adenine-specific)
MEYLIKTYTNEGNTVLDFCMGSGTTGVACKNLNRDFIGIELEKEYFEVSKKRINNSCFQMSMVEP